MEEPPAPADAPPAAIQVAPTDVQRVAAYRARLREITPHAWLTPVLIAANVAVFIAMVATGVHIMDPAGEALLKWGADFEPYTAGGQWWRLFTSMFVHIGLIHILMNMVVLYDIGMFVERRVGTASFAAIYLISGLVGSLASIAIHQNQVSAGASGAIFGCYGAFLAFLLREKGDMPPEVRSRLLKNAVTFVVINLVYGFSNKGIDMSAHGGGFVAGALAGLLVAHPLTPEGLAGRTRRAGLLLVVGLAATAAAAFALRTPNIQPDIDAFLAAQNSSLKALNDATAHQISNAELATVLEKDVLPGWRAARARLLAVKEVPRRRKAYFDQLLEYARLREEGWTLLIEAVRAGDDEKAKAAEAKLAEAKKIVEEMNKLR